MASAPIALESHPTPHNTHLVARWLSNLRTLLAIAAVWALLHYAIDGRVLIRSATNPLILTAGPLGMLGGLVVMAVWWVGVVLAGFIGPSRSSFDALRLSSAGVAAWAFGNATVDDWLIAQNPHVGPPTATPYSSLFVEYGVLALTLLGAAAIAIAISPGGKLQDVGKMFGANRPAGGKPQPSRHFGAAALAAIILGTVIIPMLMGPVQAHTRVLQVYFAVSAGLWLVLYFTRKLVAGANLTALWPLPWALGLLGVVIATMWPTLQVPLEYKGLNSLAAWGLVRALPVQLVSVGIATILWTASRGAGPAGEVHPVAGNLAAPKQA